jgi:hypothetical protein
MGRRVVLNFDVFRFRAQEQHVRAAWKHIVDVLHQMSREVRIEQQLQGTPSVTMRRSRSAAKEGHA